MTALITICKSRPTGWMIAPTRADLANKLEARWSPYPSEREECRRFAATIRKAPKEHDPVYVGETGDGHAVWVINE